MINDRHLMHNYNLMSEREERSDYISKNKMCMQKLKSYETSVRSVKGFTNIIKKMSLLLKILIVNTYIKFPILINFHYNS